MHLLVCFYVNYLSFKCQEKEERGEREKQTGREGDQVVSDP
jgi:hypothetical protein